MKPRRSRGFTTRRPFRNDRADPCAEKISAPRDAPEGGGEAVQAESAGDASFLIFPLSHKTVYLQ